MQTQTARGLGQRWPQIAAQAFECSTVSACYRLQAVGLLIRRPRRKGLSRGMAPWVRAGRLRSEGGGHRSRNTDIERLGGKMRDRGTALQPPTRIIYRCYREWEL